MKPIIMSTEDVLALLDGLKTMKRMPVKFGNGSNPSWTGYIPDGAVLYGSNNVPEAKSPIRPGDVLWVRETWRVGAVVRSQRNYLNTCRWLNVASSRHP